MCVFFYLGIVCISMCVTVVWCSVVWCSVVCMCVCVLAIYYTGIRDLDSQLGSYPYESLKIWYSLTNHIREPLLKRCGYHIM